MYQQNLCFEHLRLDKLKNGGGSAGGGPTKRRIDTPNKGTVIELVNSIKTQPKFAQMLSYSITCVTKLAVDEVAVEEILEQGTVEELEKALALHPNNEKLHRQYMEVLQAFSMNSRMARQVGRSCKNNFNKLGSSLRNHSDVNTHIATARAMAALADDCENMDAMADQGVLDALADAVKRNPNNADLLAAAAKVFSKFANYKNEYADFITRSGATEVIIAGMQSQPHHLELAKNGAELLSILAGTGAHNLDALKQQGAVDALLAALDAHPTDKELEGYATRALALLTGEDDMMRALNVFTGDTALDLAAAKALSTVSSLLLVADNVDTMFRHKGVEWLIALLTSAEGMHDALGNKILEHGLRALMRAANDANKIYDIMRHGGVQLLINILNTHTDMGVLAAALGALARLVGDREENAIYIVNHGGCNAALRAYALYPNEVAIVRPCLDLLMSIARFPCSAEGMVGAGTLEALVDMLRRHMNDVGIVTDCITALGRLATSAVNVQRMTQAGLLPLLIEALKRHIDDEGAVRAALLAIETAALLPENIPELLRLGAVEAIRAAMARWPLNADIQAIGRRALDLLLQSERDAAAARDAAERARLEAERLAALERERLAALERERLAREAELERLRRERLEREAMEREMAEALARLKMQDEEEERQRLARERKEWEDNIKLKAMRAKEAEEQAHLESLLKSTKPIAPVKPPTHRSARAIFDADSDDDEPPIFELPPEVKQFLLAGQLLTKHSKTALPASRHVYLLQDLSTLIWNKPMTEIHAKNTMDVTSIYAVQGGHCTPQLQRVRFGQPLAGHPDHCFSISGSTEGHERTVDLECKTMADRDKWVHAINQLIRWAKSKKLYGSATVHMTTTKKVAKIALKEQK